jgi:excisionase family DNA binding protein
MSDYLYSVTEAADALGISRRTAYREIGRGRLRVTVIGNRLFIPAAELARVARQRENEDAA